MWISVNSHQDEVEVTITIFTEPEVTNCFSKIALAIIKENKRPSQQPALGALTFLRSFVAGRANLCSHLLASLVHFTVVKSQAILSILASWGHRSYFCRNFISFASFKTMKISTSLDMFRHNNFACGLCIPIVALTATM